ncbi:MAG: hypothetical protein V8T46_08635 [Sutterella seckii]
MNVPIIYFSVRWWNTLHQGASITSRGSSIADVMLYTIFIMLAAGTIYGVAVVLSRARTMMNANAAATGRRRRLWRESLSNWNSRCRFHLHEWTRLLRLVRIRAFTAGVIYELWSLITRRRAICRRIMREARAAEITLEK